MEQDMRIRIDYDRPLQPFVLAALKNHLTGLEICYNGPGGARIYKFKSIERNPANVTFMGDNGRQTNVLEHFQNTGRTIRYPALPCIQIGNNVRQQTVPMEYCSILDTQVILVRL